MNKPQWIKIKKSEDRPNAQEVVFLYVDNKYVCIGFRDSGNNYKEINLCNGNYSFLIDGVVTHWRTYLKSEPPEDAMPSKEEIKEEGLSTCKICNTEYKAPPQRKEEKMCFNCWLYPPEES